MRNNFQSNGSRGTFLGLSKDYGLGLPRHWKVITTTLLLLFTLSIGQMWGSTSYYNLFYGTTKAVDGSNVNSDDFKYFGATINTSASSTTIGGNTYTHYIKLKDYASSIATDSTKVLAYDAKTTHTKITAYVKNGDSNARDFYIGRIVEGETEEQTGSGKQVKQNVAKAETAKVVFELDNTTNTLIGLFGGGKANWEIYQVIVEESGTPLLKGGETGYELAFPGRVGASGKFTATTTPTMIDGMELRASNSLKYLNGPLKLKQTNSYIKFTLATAQTVKVTPYNTRKFIFSTTATPSGSETKYGGTGGTEVSVELAAGTYYLESESSSELQLSKIAFAAASCTEPTTTFANGEYTVGGSALDLSTLIGNNNSSGAITYEVKNANGTGASISTASFTATTAGTCMVTATQAADGGKCEKVIDATITVSAPSTPTHGISYTNLKGSDVSAYPTTYYEGTGIASFAALADVADFHFNGWSPSSIPTTAKADPFEVSATWVAAYNVTFSYGAGGGTVPASFQKWQGAKFNLPGQGSMTAPSGKVFDGWKASGTKYAENAEYTMGSAPVEFVAQWKAVPQTIYSLTVTNTSSVNLNNGGAQNDLADDATIVGGGAYMQNDHASSAQQILGSTKLQFKAGSITLAMTLNTALKEGDTIKATGLNSEGLCFGVTFNRTDNLDNQLASDASYFVVPEEFEGKTTLYAWRHSGSGTTCASIIIRRPADRPISSTTISLSDLKVNNRSISSDSLAVLVSTHSLTLKDEFVTAPVIKFNRHKVITFADSEEPTQAIYDRAYSVTATTVSSQWQAAQEINDITYTVTATKITSYTVAYKDENGTTSLGSEVVAVGEHPTASGITAKKAYHSFAGWTLSGNPVELTGVSAEAGETVTLVASYTPAYATSVNIEQWVLDNSKNNTAFRAVLNERHYTYSNLNDLDSLTTARNETDRNEPYLGQKWKKNNSEIGFLLKSGSTVRAKFGYVGNNVNIKIGSADAITKTAAQLETPYEYTASEDVIIKLQGTGENTVVVKQIMIDEAIATVKLHAIVTYDAGTGSYGKANEKYTGTPLVIGNATPVTDSIFAGWYLGDDQIDATAYVPTKNVTLQAHYAPKEYTINYNEGEHGETAIVVASAGWGTEYTAIANPFTPEEGYIFTGWAVTGVDGVSTIAAGGSFTMPKNAVTLTAQWEDVSKVAVIVETNVKYESLADAVAAATDGQTIQLLQNNNVTAQVEVAGKAITLDLAGYKIEYTGTSTLPSGVILVHNGASLTIDDSSDPDAGSIVSGSNAYAAIALTKAGDDAANPAVLEINGGTFTGDYYAITGNGSRHNTEITINAGTFSGAHANDNSAIYHPQQGTLIINGGTFTGYSAAIELRAGTLEINDGTFTATATEYTCNPSGSGTTTVGAAIAIAQHNTQKPISVTINGGTFEGVKAINEANPQNNPTSAVDEIDIAVKGGDFTGAVTTVDVDNFISGGTFDAPVSNKNSAEGFVPQTTPNAQGKYSVEPKDGVCLIGTKVTGDTSHGTVYGYYAGTADVKVSSKSGDYTYKFNKGNYIGVTLVDGQNFQAGDVVKIRVSAHQNATGFTLYTTKGTDSVLIMDTRTSSVIENGIHSLVLPNTYAGSQSLYLLRQNNDYTGNMNLCADSIAVYRVIYPTLTAITINGEDAVKGTGNAFSVTLPEEGTNLASMTIVPTIVRNAAHATTPEAVVSNEGAWVAGENTYRVMDKDGDYTDYTITIVLQGASATPSITTQPASANYYEGASIAALTVVAESTAGDLSYQWQVKNGLNYEDIDGATVASYTPAISAIGSYTYRVVVTNLESGKVATSVNSNEATIVIAADPSCATFAEASLPTADPYQYTNTDEWTIYNASTSGKRNGSDQVFGDVKDFEGNTVKGFAKERCVLIFEKDMKQIRFYSANAQRAWGETPVRVSDDVETFLGTGTPSYSEYAATTSLIQADPSNNKEQIFIANGEFLAGKCYWFAFSGSLQIFQICAVEADPKADAPVFSGALSDEAICQGNTFATLDATAAPVTSYAWYKDDEVIAGATAATYTPTEAGTYYCIATNSSEGYRDNSTKSAEAVLSVKEATSVTMSDISGKAAASIALNAVATGANPHYAWFTCDDAEGNNAVAIAGAADAASYAIPTPVATQYYKVVVTTDCGSVSAVALVTLLPDIVPLADVTESTVWDWSVVTKVADGSDLSGNGPTVTTGNGLVIANYLQGDNFDKIEGNNGAFSIRSSSNKFYQGASLHMHTTKGGILTIRARNEGHAMTLNVENEGRDIELGNLGDWKNYTIYVKAGDVTIYNVPAESTYPMRVAKITFTVDETPDYTRNVTNNIGTLCVDHNVVAGGALGATFYQIASRNELYDYKIDFEEVLPSEELKAGEPYIFQSTTGRIDLFFGETETENPVAVRGMIGNYAAGTLAITEDNQHTILYIAQNKLWTCENLVGQDLILNEHRAYIDMTQVPTYEAYQESLQQQQNSAPGRRRVTLGTNAEQVATGFDALNAEDAPVKMMINGQIFILRGEKLYDATGRLVK